MSHKDFESYQKELDEAMRNMAEPVPFVHLAGCDGGPWDYSVTFGGDRQCWRCQTANSGYEQGQRDMLAKCIAAVEAALEKFWDPSDADELGWLGQHELYVAALRALDVTR